MHVIIQGKDWEHVYLFLFPDQLEHLRQSSDDGDPKVDFNISNAVMGARKIFLVGVSDVEAGKEIMEGIGKFFATKTDAEVFTIGPHGVAGN